jgi:hypothetical protein
MTPGDTLDEGVFEIRGGGAVHDRDEAFRLSSAASGGYLLDTTITPLDGRYRCQTQFAYDAGWRALGARADVRHGAAAHHVEIVPFADHATITLRRATDPDEVRQVRFDPATMIDLEPSALPMWVMTRRYDRPAAGVQSFSWIGRSLIRDLVLEGGRTPLECHGTEARGERFTFSERYPLPNGGEFTVSFELLLDSRGLLSSFEITTGASRIRGTRRQ